MQPLLEKIVEECIRVQGLTYAEKIAEQKYGLPFPPAIPVAAGQIDTSDEGFKAIGELSGRYEWEPPALKATVSKDTYAKAVLYAFGDSISGLRDLADANDENWPALITKLFEDKLNARISGTLRDRTEIVPCHIFDADQDAPTFQIGPVTFYPRSEWLKSLDPKLVMTTLVEDVWANRLQVDELRAKVFTAGADAPTRGAYNAVATIGSHWWVGTVDVANYDPIQSSRKASIVVSIALDFLALLFNPTDGARLIYAGGERMPFSERRLSVDNNKLFTSTKISRPGLGGPPNWAKRVLTESEQLRNAAGTVLDRYNRDSATGNISRLLERWVNALHWYGQALREPSDFMAVVKYGCALDILTDGEGKCSLIAERSAEALGIAPDTVVTTDKQTLIDVVNAVFNFGRSALAHGSSFGLLADKRDERALANNLVHPTLLAFTEPLAEVVAENHRMLTLTDNEMRAFTERLKNWAARERKATE